MDDRFTPVGPATDENADGPLKKLGWFVVFAMGGLAAVAGLAYILRAALFIG